MRYIINDSKYHFMSAFDTKTGGSAKADAISWRSAGVATPISTSILRSC